MYLGNFMIHFVHDETSIKMQLEIYMLFYVFPAWLFLLLCRIPLKNCVSIPLSGLMLVGIWMVSSLGQLGIPLISTLLCLYPGGVLGYSYFKLYEKNVTIKMFKRKIKWRQSFIISKLSQEFMLGYQCVKIKKKKTKNDLEHDFPKSYD